jgi:hypothetical protein
MFLALFAHHQEAMHLQHLVYFVRITVYIPIVVYAVPPDDEQIVLETREGC